MQQYNFESMSHIDRFRLTVKRMSLGKSRSLNFHDHDFSEIAVVLAVSDTLHHCNGKTFKLAVGDVIVLHPGVVHAYENTAGFEVVNIIYDAAQLPLPQLDGGNLKFFQAMVDMAYLPREPEKQAWADPWQRRSEGNMSEYPSAAYMTRRRSEDTARPISALCPAGS